MSRLLMLVLSASGLAACAPTFDVASSQRAAMRFDGKLAGLVRGPTRNCLPPRSTATVVAARGNTLLFREGRAIYANESSGGCEALADNRFTMVSESFGGSLCSGSFARVVDLTGGGTLRGTCVLGEFTTYRRP